MEEKIHYLEYARREKTRIPSKRRLRTSYFLCAIVFILDIDLIRNYFYLFYTIFKPASKTRTYDLEIFMWITLISFTILVFSCLLLVIIPKTSTLAENFHLAQRIKILRYWQIFNLVCTPSFWLLLGLWVGWT